MPTFLFNAKALREMIEQAPSDANVIGVSINYPFEGDDFKCKVYAEPMKFTKLGSGPVLKTESVGKLVNRSLKTASEINSLTGAVACPAPPNCDSVVVTHITTALNLSLPLPE